MLCQINFYVLIWALAANCTIAAPSFSGFQTFDDTMIDNNNNNDSDIRSSLFSRNNKVISHVLDMNDSNTSSLLSNFNITKDEIFRRIAAASTSQPAFHQNHNDEIRNRNRHYENVDGTHNHTNEKELIVEQFRRTIQSGFRITPDGATVNQIAFYPVCSKNSANSWLAENTAKLYFSSTMFEKLQPNTHLHKAELRLLQKNPNEEDATPQPPLGCDEIDEIITVTISVIVKKPRGNNRTANSRRDNKFKKRVCNSFTVSKRNTGWIAINVEQVIKQWEKAYRSNSSNSPIADPMLMIDVEDQDKLPLKAGTFFQPNDCQASTAIPWTVYGESFWNISGASDVPPYPRLDIKWSRMDSAQYQYNHPMYHQNRRRNLNRLENVRLLREPALNIENNPHQHHQSSHHNFRYISENQPQHQQSHHDHSQLHRGHKKRHNHRHHKHQVESINSEQLISEEEK